MGCVAWSAQPAEEAADVFDHEVGCVLGCEVAAPLVTVPTDDVGVVAFGKAPHRLEVFGEEPRNPVGVVVGPVGCSFVCASS